MERTQLTNEQIIESINIVTDNLNKTLFKKGYGTYSSKHEILGCITEEYSELVNAVHSKNNNNVKEELIDIAVGCIFALSCMENNTVDW